MKWFACLVVMSIAAAAEARQTQSPPPAFTPADEAAIMRVVIDWIVQPANNANGPVGTTGPVLVTQTLARCDVTPRSPVRECVDSSLVEGFLGGRNASKFASIPESVRAGFLAVNKDPRALPNPERPGLILISEEAYSELPKAMAFWDVFRQRYPGAAGYVRFGSTYFDAPKNEAWVYVYYIYGSLGGVGELVHLGRRDGRWEILRAIHLWVS